MITRLKDWQRARDARRAAAAARAALQSRVEQERQSAAKVDGERSARINVYCTRDYAPGETIAVIRAQHAPIFTGDSITLSFSAAYTDEEFAVACEKPDYSERPQ